MKSIGRSFLMAFSGYSISPKSSMDRSKENCGFILIFIPFIGAIICTVLNRWAVLYPYACDFQILPAVVGAVVPTILSAGAHLDGFFRTTDALSSHKSREEKLKILREDAHGGYSAIMMCICYFMVAIGIWSEMPIDGIFVIAFGYIISRALYGISILTMKHAAYDGMVSKIDAYVPDSAVGRWIQVLINLGYIVISAVLMYNIACTYSVPKPSVAIACLVGAAVSYIYYLIISYKNFGGVTEESGGFFVMLCEVIIPIAALAAFKSPF